MWTENTQRKPLIQTVNLVKKNLNQMSALVWEICMDSQAWMLAPLGPIILRKSVPCQQIPFLFMSASITFDFT